MNYYCFIAGMPDLQPGTIKDVPELENLVQDLSKELSSKDLSLLQLILEEYDNKNFLSYLADKEAPLSSLGRLSRDEFDVFVNTIKDDEIPKNRRIPDYYLPFYHTINDEKTAQTIALHSDYLASLYYEKGCKSSNAFLSSWFTFCLNLNNVLTAYYCRKYNMDVKEYVVGNNAVAKELRKSNARDFGLGDLVENLDTIFAIAEEPNLLERERRIDLLKWKWLEEQTFFHYFSIERILAYFIRCQLLLRWKGLSAERGKEVFENLLTEMERQVNL